MSCAADGALSSSLLVLFLLLNVVSGAYGLNCGCWEIMYVDVQHIILVAFFVVVVVDMMEIMCCQNLLGRCG